MEDNNIWKQGESTIIVNGGNPLEDCPTDWDKAREWIDEANEDKETEVKWSFDCGFKLDYDGALLEVASRFYPPKTHSGDTWDGTVTIMLFGHDLIEKKFDCKTLEELKKEVENYVNGFQGKIYNCLK